MFCECCGMYWKCRECTAETRFESYRNWGDTEEEEGENG